MEALLQQLDIMRRRYIANRAIFFVVFVMIVYIAFCMSLLDWSVLESSSLTYRSHRHTSSYEYSCPEDEVYRDDDNQSLGCVIIDRGSNDITNRGSNNDIINRGSNNDGIPS